MDDLTIQELAKFETSSWALWSKKFNHAESLENNPNKLYEFIVNQREDFKKDIIFLGLNRSKIDNHNGSGFFTNFHTPSHSGDGLLKKLITQFPRLHGGYMTDLSVEVESDSSNVKINSTTEFNRLKKQLDLLDTRHPFLICFGEKVYKQLQKFFKNISLIREFSDVDAFKVVEQKRTYVIFKVIHYSYAVRYNKKARLKNQFQEIVTFIKNQAAS